MIKKSCNLIGQEHSGQFLAKQNFPCYVVFKESQDIISAFSTISAFNSDDPNF